MSLSQRQEPFRFLVGSIARRGARSLSLMPSERCTGWLATSIAADGNSDESMRCNGQRQTPIFAPARRTKSISRMTVDSRECFIDNNLYSLVNLCSLLVFSWLYVDYRCLFHLILNFPVTFSHRWVFLRMKCRLMSVLTAQRTMPDGQ